MASDSRGTALEKDMSYNKRAVSQPRANIIAHDVLDPLFERKLGDGRNAV